VNPNDIRRGDDQGYRGAPTRPAASNAERFGRQQGADRRQAEIDAASRRSGGGSGIPARYALFGLLVGAVLLVGIRLFSQSLDTLGLLAVSVVGLAATPLVRRLIRSATPVYAGTLIGLALGSAALLLGDRPLTTDNLFVYPALGAVFGVLWMVVRLSARRPAAP
tara:strand:+ start:33952 stop:34446 length:495 start_codon:yes stop_codon:yes gene_type:complete